jgi:hypothetical protein
MTRKEFLRYIAELERQSRAKPKDDDQKSKPADSDSVR